MTVALSSPRLAIYARYSSELQNPRSVDDQVAMCRTLITDHFHPPDPSKVLVFSDAAISGATMDRPGMIRLMAAARAGRIEVVVTEGLDRLSRSLKDIAAVHETLAYHGVKIWTSHEGWITELHIGLKGTMNALYLRDMKARVQRGHKARIAAGFAASSCAYGYRVVRGVVDDKGRNVNGVREIDDEAAAVIRRIYQEFADGLKTKDIIARLNAEGIPAPAGGLWKPNALIGGAKKQMGILRNEIYLGKLIFNRSRVVREPVTNKKRYILNPEADWTRVDVPHLRIISDDLWQRVRLRDHCRPQERKSKPNALGERVLTSHNQHALTGWIKCGWCGGNKSLANLTRYLCSTHRYAKKCTNSRGTKEAVLLAAVFDAVQARIHDGPSFRGQLLQACQRETRQQAKLEKRRGAVECRIARLLDAVERGVDEDLATDRIMTLQDELAEVRRDLLALKPIELPDEAAIRAALAREVAEIEVAGDVRRMRLMFKCLLGEVVLTPIPDKRSGETTVVTLREDGWPEFWRMISCGQS